MRILLYKPTLITFKTQYVQKHTFMFINMFISMSVCVYVNTQINKYMNALLMTV